MKPKLAAGDRKPKPCTAGTLHSYFLPGKGKSKSDLLPSSTSSFTNTKNKSNKDKASLKSDSESESHIDNSDSDSESESSKSSKSCEDVPISSISKSKASAKATETKTSGGEKKEKKKKYKSLTKWQNDFKWITYRKRNGSVFCDICTEAINAKLLLPKDNNSQNAKETFVTTGFTNWAQGNRGFRNHEKSTFHKEAFNGLQQLKSGVKITEALSQQKINEMKEARSALEKIFDTALFIGIEGLPFRGHDDRNSKFSRLLELRSSDVPELKRWLNRTSYKWNSHQIIEEIFGIFSNEVVNHIVSDVKSAKYFTIILDETSDISGCEQVSISFRYVDDDLITHEQFVGFYETKKTTGEVLYKIVKDVLTRLNFDISNLRGQCYDGASNVRYGLSSRISEEEPRALYIHCVAHRLNLVVTDAMNGITSICDFIGTIKGMINYVRDSPKRLGFFKDLQQNSDDRVTDSELKEKVRLRVIY